VALWQATFNTDGGLEAAQTQADRGFKCRGAWECAVLLEGALNSNKYSAIPHGEATTGPGTRPQQAKAQPKPWHIGATHGLDLSRSK
jgi:hypothetical protein